MQSLRTAKSSQYQFLQTICVLLFLSFIVGSSYAETINSSGEVESATPVQLVNGKETKLLFNNDWQYLENATRNIDKVIESNSWSSVQLPHTWNATDTVDAVAGYRRSASWYKKQFRVSGGERQVLYFEGSNMETEVYLNGQLAGKNVGGYIGFEVELTPFILLDKTNTLLVRVSNEYNPNLIPSQKADFFLHGGIIRDVWFKNLPLTFIDHLDVNPTHVSHESAGTAVKLYVQGSKNDAKKYHVDIQLVSPEGKPVLTQKINLNSAVGATAVDVNLGSLAKPVLWSVDSPNLYTINAALIDEQGNIVQRSSDRFGYRWFEMRPHQGFFLNGEKLLIKGTHRHEESAGLGAALPNEMHRRDMQMIKDMGANFVRLAHYPQDPEVYRAADELGLILWDELPWCRGGKGGDLWEKNTESYLRRQIAQNRNHPSIIFWSLGNEMNWDEDFVGGGSDKVVLPYVQKLNKIVKELDPSRITTLRKYYPAAKIVDAFSPSIWAGWYGGAYGQYGEAIAGAIKTYPRFLHMEYGGDSHVGRHTETPIGIKGIESAQVSVTEAMNQAATKNVAKDSDWNENYMVNLFDWHLHVSNSIPNFSGNAQWVFKDFATPLRPENPIPYVNQKGLVDRNGKPKDAYYVFASYWSKKPFCYIESKTWTHREGPKEGRDVKVFCNTESAELFLEGKSLGKKTKHPEQFPAGGLVWKVPFHNGLNKLKVQGFAGATVVEDELDVHYLIGHHGPVEHIKLSSKPLAGHRVLIEAEAVDKMGNRVLDFSDIAYFSNLSESGRLLENQGTPTGSRIIQVASGYASIEFEMGNEESIIEFRTQNIKGVYLTLSANPAVDK
jgi:beta-galactosidase